MRNLWLMLENGKEENTSYVVGGRNVERVSDLWGENFRRLVGEQNPDWKLTLPDTFLLIVPGVVLDRARLDASRTHELFAMYYDSVKQAMIYMGWYGPNRAAGAEAIRPLVEALDQWRRRPRKDEFGEPIELQVGRVISFDHEVD